MQPIIKDENGTVRFKENCLVRTLLDEARKRGFTLNDLAVREFTQADWEQFYQLIGYSLVGYHELSNVSDLACAEASKVAGSLFPAASGCRDHGCEIHLGVLYDPEGRDR